VLFVSSGNQQFLAIGAPAEVRRGVEVWFELVVAKVCVASETVFTIRAQTADLAGDEAEKYP